KFPQADETLTTRMKSVGEAMAIGRTFKEALQKALRSLEIKRFGLCGDGADKQIDPETLRLRLSIPNAERIFYLAQAFQDGMSIDEAFELTKIDKWFLRNVQQIVSESQRLGSARVSRAVADVSSATTFATSATYSRRRLPHFERPMNTRDECATRDKLLRAKKLGFSDRQLAVAGGAAENEIRTKRKSADVIPTYRLVDTCAAEFEAYTPYYYSTYGDENEYRESGKRKIMILGGGPNRIGQGIEFDYCCVHAAFALRELGFETIMVNSNPETVSTDYDTSDKLYFEPLTLEDVLNIYDQEKPEGVFVQFGGQTPLNLANGLKAAGVSILGTQPESIETAEDRQLFAAMLDKLGLRQTPSGSAVTTDEAAAIANKTGYPVLVRPSFVLGGRAMELVYNEEDLRRYMTSAIEVTPDRPVLVDRFLEDAIEVDVDCISDGETTVIGAIMEHIEEAGIHSGDSACVIPTFSLPQKVLEEISAATRAMARELNVQGLMNVQFAVKGED
ncbi:MAG: carbamoyl phosphate synthase large subunit, partial [Verrucomicrobia bacterium]